MEKQQKNGPKDFLDVRLYGPHKLALQKLKERNGEKTPVGMVRLLIRDAAKEAGMWEEVTTQVSTPETEVA